MNYHNKIIYSTESFTLDWNDKIIAKFKKFINDIKEVKIYKTNQFKLLEKNNNSKVKEVIYYRL